MTSELDLTSFQGTGRTMDLMAEKISKEFESRRRPLYHCRAVSRRRFPSFDCPEPLGARELFF